jgi:SWI/SNF-related matrix-associated actin-dependent regulator 1 of chromatin subfamily A
MTNLQETAKELKNACQVLSSLCDGACAKDAKGFNKPDASFGNWIALVPSNEWTSETCAAVRDMLTKYVGQLNSAGIDSLPQVREVEFNRATVFNDMKAKGQLAKTAQAVNSYRSGSFSRSQLLEVSPKSYMGEIKGQALQLFSPKDYEFIQDIKEIQPWQNRRWNPEHKCWEVRFDALDKANKGLLFSLITKFNVVIKDSDMELLLAETEAEKAAKTAIHVYIQDSNIVFCIPFNREAVNRIKESLQGRRWNPDCKVWTAPASALNLKKAAKLATEFGWNLSKDFEVDASDKIEKAEKNVEDSQAVEADLELPGLSSDYSLYPFQKAGVRYALKNKTVMIGDEMGLGKTLQASATVVTASAYPCLVICPKAVKKQWKQEINKFFPEQTVSLVEKKGTDWEANFIVINYDIVKKNFEKLSDIPFKAVVLDESHYIKNPKAARSQAVLALSEGVEYKIALTGTPVLNKPIELTNQLSFLGRLENPFGGFFPFAKQYCDAQKTRYGWDMSGARNLEELAEVLRGSCFVRREKKQVFAELPELQRTTISCEVSRSGAKKFSKSLKKLVEDLSSGEVAETSILEEINRLKREAAQLKYDSAIDWIKNFLDSSDEKLVLFAHHRDIQAQLFEDLSAFNPAKIMGADSGDKREQNIKKFWEDDSCKVIVCSLKAANVGINLQNASNVAFMEFAWHSGDMDQAEARVHRIGSEASSINSYWLVGEGTFDNDLVDLIEAKREIVEAVNQGVEVKKFNMFAWLKQLAENI